MACNFKHTGLSHPAYSSNRLVEWGSIFKSSSRSWKNEGAIKFSLNGPNYHHKNSPSYIFQPKVGDIALFPSSLHHKTIPFSTDTERIMISFDLQPATAKLTSERTLSVKAK